MRVMQVKYNSRVKNQQVNSRTQRNGGPFSLNYTGRGIKQGVCCNEGIYVPEVPSHQQSYGLYLKRATMGIGGGGLASKVVDPSVNTVQNKGIVQTMLTYKRPQDFTINNYIENKKLKAIRCGVMDKCDGSNPKVYTGLDKAGNPNRKPEKICYNTNCKKIPCITEDLGYDTASDQINRRLAMRAGPSLTAEYESPIMQSGAGNGCR